MRKSFALSVPVPCHEKWESFQPTANGAFCRLCSKEVIDFTGWTEAQIRGYFSKRPSNTCGRFHPHQLKRYTEQAAPGVLYKRLPAAALAFSLLLAAQPAISQPPSASKRTPELLASHEAMRTGDTLAIPRVRGLVRSGDDNAPLPGANVMLKGASVTTVTDADGRFELPWNQQEATDTLVVSFIGFSSREIPARGGDDVMITLSPEITRLGGTMVVGGAISYRRWSPRALWWRLKNFLR